MNIRKSVRNVELNPIELQSLRKAFDNMMGIRDERGYAYNAGIHGIPQFMCKHAERSSSIRDPNFRLFLPWHRAYLYTFEKYLQDAARDPSITVPWWDYTSEDSRRDGIPNAYNDELVEGNPNPLYKSHVIIPNNFDIRQIERATNGCYSEREFDTHREPGSPSELPTPEKIEEVLSKPDYGDFSDGIEEIHNDIHGWVGGMCGAMSWVLFSSYDPIFWAHHCMIDRLFYLWQMQPNHSLPLYLYDEVLDPFNMTVRQVINIYELGYSYAGQQILLNR